MPRVCSRTRSDPPAPSAPAPRAAQVLSPNHYLAVDHAYRSVVLSLCGTSHAADLLTDLVANAVPFLGGKYMVRPLALMPHVPPPPHTYDHASRGLMLSHQYPKFQGEIPYTCPCTTPHICPLNTPLHTLWGRTVRGSRAVPK